MLCVVCECFSKHIECHWMWHIDRLLSVCDRHLWHTVTCVCQGSTSCRTGWVRAKLSQSSPSTMRLLLLTLLCLAQTHFVSALSNPSFVIHGTSCSLSHCVRFVSSVAVLYAAQEDGCLLCSSTGASQTRSQRLPQHTAQYCESGGPQWKGDACQIELCQRGTHLCGLLWQQGAQGLWPLNRLCGHLWSVR